MSDMIWALYTIVFILGAPMILASLFAAIWSVRGATADRLVQNTILVTGSIAIVIVALVGVAGLPAYGTHPIGLLLMVFVAAWLSVPVALAASIAAACSWLIRRVAG